MVRSLVHKLKAIYYTHQVKRKAKVMGRIRVNGSGKIIGAHNLHIGDNTHFAGLYYINALGGVWIGENCHISRNFTLYSCNHDYAGTAIPYDDNLVLKPVNIKDNVWIGMNVSIIPGVTIGHGAIIGMGSVVAGKVPPLAIVGGNPATIVKFRNAQHYEKLVARGFFGGTSGRLVIKKPKS